MEKPKYITIDGVSFCRDETTGYYLNGTLGVRAHRYVYAKAFGSIPPGYHVHHKDEDKSNNELDNLELLLAGEHIAYHGSKRALDPEWLEWSRNNMAATARPAASKWHGSEAGLAWHREHAKISLLAKEPQDFICAQCETPFSALSNGRIRFCSNACKSASRRAASTDDVTRNCGYCAEPFQINQYKKTRTCSRSCANRLRAKERHAL